MLNYACNNDRHVQSDALDSTFRNVFYTLPRVESFSYHKHKTGGCNIPSNIFNISVK